nr:UDP-N-acetylmuramoyl-L-alanine--D-glutamate ligase [Nocardioides sp. zg-DK7169]
MPATGTVVWGYGREGAAVAAELARRGLDATIALPDAGTAPADAPLPVRLGAAATEALRAARAVVVSPGVPATADLQVELREAGVPLTGLTDLWLGDHAGLTIGVTGTKGKSTTASLVAHVCRAVGLRSAVLGNVGTPVLSADPAQLDVVALEVSSYQARTVTTSPRVVVLTSLYAEHLPWHGGYAQYVHDKLNLLAHGPEHVVAAPGTPYDEAAARLDGRTVLHRPDAEHVHVDQADGSGDLVWPGVGRLRAEELPLPGRHNAANCALALRAVDVAGLLADDDARRTALASLRDFAPLAHRLEPVASTDGRAWYDDSLATAPEAVVAALEVWPDEPLVLLFGGADRGLELDPLVTYLGARATPVTVHAFGAAGTRLAAALPDDGPHAAHLAAGFADAVRAVLASDDPARRVLFSPGAPSFDEYADYRDRAAALRALLGS